MEENNINIEEIMADIKREIKEKGLTGDMLSFEDVPYKKTPQAGGSVKEALDFLNSNYNVQPYKELKGNPLKVVFKKIIRKLMKFYIEPTVNDQNNVNSSIVTVLNGLADNSPEKALNKAETIELAQKELLIRIEKLEKENEELRKALGKQENV
ncbi:MAG: hypothetical protein BWZ04_01461 [Firmicutes bacterium ADurb.BinA205]|nr:MAG: hypothetical protein BWZ04_01461 [Firmicutes bacterium ADurb.BinA205]